MNARSQEHMIGSNSVLCVDALPLLSVPRTSEWQRWGISFTLVLAVFGGLISVVHTPNDKSPLHVVPMVAVMIDLAPPPTEVPEQKKSLPPLKALAPVQQPAQRLNPSPPKVKADVKLPQKPHIVKPPTQDPPKEAPKEEARPESVAKQHVVVPLDRAASAKSTATTTPAATTTRADKTPLQSNAVSNWQNQVLAYLAREKQYPRAARARRQEGVAKLRFRVNKEGKVVSYTLEKSSGYSLLDREVVAMIERIKRFPPPPSKGGQVVELVVPVQFNLR